MPKIEERLTSAKPHERVAGRIVGVSNREPGTQHPVPGAGENIEQKSFASRFAGSTKRAVEMAWKGMGTEATETREMGVSFFRMLEHKLRLNERDDPPSKEEVKRAIEQLKDVGRISFFASVSILPGGGISLLGLEILARKFGMKNFTFVPSAFRKRNKDD